MSLIAAQSRTSTIDHSEIKKLPIKPQHFLLTKQFYAPQHPCHDTLNLYSPFQIVRLRTDSKSPLFSNPNPDGKTVWVVQNALHSRHVVFLPPQPSSRNSSPTHFGRRKVNTQEHSQPSSHNSEQLHLYKNRHRLDPSIPDSCPKCQISPHDTHHLLRSLPWTCGTCQHKFQNS